MRFLFPIRAAVAASLLALTTSAPAQIVEDYVEMIEACHLGDLKGVKKGLEKGIHIDQPDKAGWSPLAHALEYAQLDVARHLIDRGADLNLLIEHWEPSRPLCFAIRTDNLDIVKHMVEKGANPDPSNDAEHPLQVACTWGFVDIVKYLESKGVDSKKYRSGQGNTALTLAVHHKNTDVVRYLLDSGHDPNLANDLRILPLALAAVYGDSKTLQVLLNAGADPNKIEKSAIFKQENNVSLPYTALNAAIRDNHVKNVRLLLEAGADPKLLDNQAIRWADLLGNQKIYDLLLANGAAELPPYSFNEIEDLKPAWKQAAQKVVPKSSVDWGFSSLVNKKKSANAKAPGKLPDFSIAVLPMDEGSRDAEVLLTTQLSQHDSVRVVERAEIDRIVREKSLNYNAFTQPETSVDSGKLLGADVLVLLSKNESLCEARVVSTATGLVMDTIQVAPAVDAKTWSQQIHDSVVGQADLLVKAPDGWTLVSIPQISSAETSYTGLEIEQSFSKALARHLGAQPDFFILERKEMSRLALEKTLSEDLRNFYSSGWLLDGSFELISNDEGNIAVTLRLRAAKGAEIRIEETGNITEMGALLDRLTRKIVSETGNREPVPFPAKKEADAYFAEAKRAYDAKLWELAQLSSEAAWALGLREDALSTLRMQSIVQRIQNGRDVSFATKIGQHTKTNLFYEDFPTHFLLAQLAPLQLPKTFPQELSAEQYIDLSQQLLDIFEPIIFKKTPRTGHELDLLWVFSDVLNQANAPLEILSSLSDEAAYFESLESLRRRMERLTLAAMADAKARNYTAIYHGLWRAYMIHLPFWKLDDEELMTETLRLLQVASELEEPYSKHEAYGALFEIAERRMRAFSGRAYAHWKRLGTKLTGRDDPHQELLGRFLLKDSVISNPIANRHRYRCNELVEELLRTDESMMGFAGEYGGNWHSIDGNFYKWFQWDGKLWFDEDIDAVRGKKPIRGWLYEWDVPEKLGSDAVGFGSGMARSSERLPFSFIKNRMELVAQTGAFPGFGNNGIDLERLAPQQIVELKPIADRACDAVLKRAGNKPYSKWLAKGLDEDIRAPMRKVLDDVDFRKKAPEIRFTTYHSPMMEYDIPSDNGRSEHPPHELQYAATRGDETWVAINNLGLISLADDGSSKELIRIPEKSEFVDPNPANMNIDHIGEKYIAVWFEKLRGKPSTDIGVYDRKAKTWKFFSPKVVPIRLKNHPSGYGYGVHHICVLDGYFYYSFLSHPNPEGFKANYILRKDSNSTIGVMKVNMKTGEESLLVSTRRSPALSPLDASQRVEAFLLHPISGTSLRCLDQVYDQSSNEWRKATKQEMRIKVPENEIKTPHYQLNWGAVRSDFDQERLKVKLFTPQRGSKIPDEVLLPASHEPLKASILPKIIKSYGGEWEGTGNNAFFREVVVPGGVVFYSWYGYTFLPREELVGAINTALGITDDESLDDKPGKAKPAWDRDTLIKDGDFTSSGEDTPWRYHVIKRKHYTEGFIEDGVYTLTTEGTAPDAIRRQFGQGLPKLKPNTRYRLTFSIRGDLETSGEVPLLLGEAKRLSTKSLGLSEEIVITPQWTEHVMEFQTTKFAKKNKPTLRFLLGKQHGKVMFRKFSLTEIE